MSNANNLNRVTKNLKIKGKVLLLDVQYISLEEASIKADEWHLLKNKKALPCFIDGKKNVYWLTELSYAILERKSKNNYQLHTRHSEYFKVGFTYLDLLTANKHQKTCLFTQCRLNASRHGVRLNYGQIGQTFAFSLIDFLVKAYEVSEFWYKGTPAEYYLIQAYLAGNFTHNAPHMDIKSVGTIFSLTPERQLVSECESICLVHKVSNQQNFEIRNQKIFSCPTQNISFVLESLANSADGFKGLKLLGFTTRGSSKQRANQNTEKRRKPILHLHTRKNTYFSYDQ